MTDTPQTKRRAVTIKDVARHAGVSQGVVSRVLNDGIGPVAPDTRQRVLASIQTLRYRPHTAARELKSQKTSTIGLIVADVANEFFARLADHVVRAARVLDLGVLLTTTQEDAALETGSVEMLMDKRVRGIIAAPTGRNTAIWREVTDMGVQLVFVDRALAEVPDADVVGVDNEAAAFDATQHLIEHGHRRIAIISGPLSISTGRERVAGYRRALEQLGTDPDDELVFEADFRDPTTGGAVDALLALEDPVTAVVVSNTALAASVTRRLRDLDVAIPDDLSIVVFHDAPWTALAMPAFTVVRHPIEAIADTAVRLLNQRLTADAPQHGEQVRLTSTLVPRGSVATLPRPPLASHGRGHAPESRGA
jgi:LacI family transcriptional regulator